MAELRTEASRFLGIDDPLPNGASPAPTAAAAAPQQPILPTSTNGEGKFSVSSARPDATSEANGVLSTAPLATEREHEREGETEALCARVASTTGLAEDDPAYVAFRARHPCPLAEWAAFRRHTRGKQFIVFLDYDGTLTPIVSDPDRALLSEEVSGRWGVLGGEGGGGGGAKRPTLPSLLPHFVSLNHPPPRNEP